MKTPEEIKKGLECRFLECDDTSLIDHCKACPFQPNGVCFRALIKDSLTYIQQLEAQVPKWISVEERLPETSGRYLVCISCPRGEWIESNRYDDSEHAWEADTPGYHESSTDYVTHWMPLLPSPQEVK